MPAVALKSGRAFPLRFERRCGGHLAVRDLTVAPNKISPGASVAEELVPLVDRELRRKAAAKLARDSAAHTLPPPALRQEAWLPPRLTRRRVEKIAGPSSARRRRRCAKSSSRKRGVGTRGGRVANAGVWAQPFYGRRQRRTGAGRERGARAARDARGKRCDWCPCSKRPTISRPPLFPRQTRPEFNGRSRSGFCWLRPLSARRLSG